jgi:ferredoxin--NADP+ reductase
LNARLPEAATPPTATDAKWREERVLGCRYWTPRLLSFRITRDPAFRFVPGRYARLGLPGADGEIVWRPFSMVSGAQDDFLEFLAVLVEDGEFSLRLATLKADDTVLVEKAEFGFLTLDQLAPGDNVWMFASGSGLGPFLSILRDPAPWRAFRHIVLVHSVRYFDELAYCEDIGNMRDTMAGIEGNAELHYLPVVTRESGGTLSARIPRLIEDGRLELAAGVKLDVATSRAMVCGNPDLTQDMRKLLAARGFATSRRGVPGQMAFEKYW